MIDVIMPCYNAEKTLRRAVQSVLNQPELGILWLMDDGSTDNTFALAEHFASQVPSKIRVEKMPKNGGAAKARNWGALQSQAEFISFLDADDEYENNALQVAAGIFHFRPQTAVVRLGLKPVGLPEKYTQHPNFDYAWNVIQMTIVSNTVFRRVFFLACGGFPQEDLFRELGGEDGALGIATTQSANVATTFEEAGALYHCGQSSYTKRLLDAILFNIQSTEITPEKLAQANGVTEKICREISLLKNCLNSEKGIVPVKLNWE